MTTYDSQATFAALKDQQYINLTTFRKTGQPVTTPVWFAETDGKLYVMTRSNAGKIKRIRNSGRVELAPADRRGQALGPVMHATARILTVNQEGVADQLLNRKYGLLKRMFDLAGKLFGGATTRVFLEITASTVSGSDT